MRVRTAASELARWLERQGGSWMVEGDSTIGATLPLPASGASIAEALRARGGELEVLAPEGTGLREGDIVGATDVAMAVHDVAGHRVMQVAWVSSDGIVSDAWLLAEYAALSNQTPSSPVGDFQGSSGASAIITSWRAGYGIAGPQIRRRSS